MIETKFSVRRRGLLTFYGSICLARGRPYAVPIGPLVESCDTWHISDIADRWDGSVISAAVLRRDMVCLFEQLCSCSY